jgi:hypothetical protein
VCGLCAHVSGEWLKKVVMLNDLFTALLVLVRLCCLLIICGVTFIMGWGGEVYLCYNLWPELLCVCYFDVFTLCR